MHYFLKTKKQLNNGNCQEQKFKPNNRLVSKILRQLSKRKPKRKDRPVAKAWKNKQC